MIRTSEEPKFIKTAAAVQKWLGGVAVSMLFIVWITGWTYIVDFFKPDWVQALTYMRMIIALSSVAILSIVGYTQLIRTGDWIIESWELYKRIKEIKKDKE